MRHLMAWFEGQDNDPDSSISHITKAVASLVVLRDAVMCGTWVDDRPPKTADGWIEDLNAKVAALLEKYPEPVAPFTAVDLSWSDKPEEKNKETQNPRTSKPTPVSRGGAFLRFTSP
jgi:hypothetical protein